MPPRDHSHLRTSRDGRCGRKYQFSSLPPDGAASRALTLCFQKSKDPKTPLLLEGRLLRTPTHILHCFPQGKDSWSPHSSVSLIICFSSQRCLLNLGCLCKHINPKLFLPRFLTTSPWGEVGSIMDLMLQTKKLRLREVTCFVQCHTAGSAQLGLSPGLRHPLHMPLPLLHLHLPQAQEEWAYPGAMPQTLGLAALYLGWSSHLPLCWPGKPQGLLLPLPSLPTQPGNAVDPLSATLAASTLLSCALGSLDWPFELSQGHITPGRKVKFPNLRSPSLQPCPAPTLSALSGTPVELLSSSSSLPRSQRTLPQETPRASAVQDGPPSSFPAGPGSSGMSAGAIDPDLGSQPVPTHHVILDRPREGGGLILIWRHNLSKACHDLSPVVSASHIFPPVTFATALYFSCFRENRLSEAA